MRCLASSLIFQCRAVYVARSDIKLSFLNYDLAQRLNQAWVAGMFVHAFLWAHFKKKLECNIVVSPSEFKQRILFHVQSGKQHTEHKFSHLEGQMLKVSI